MAASRWLIGMGALVLGAALVPAQQQQPQQQQSTTQPTARRTRASLVRPWSQIADLTDEEKTKIIEIHRKGLEERAASTAKERADIVALLTDTQKQELTTYEAQAPQRARARRGTTTRPAAGQ